jgi:hypothetical protein
LTLGLFRRGVGSNQNAIITKDVVDFNIAVDRRSKCYRGCVPYYAPRSPGVFVFRLFFDSGDHSRHQLGTSERVAVEVQGRDLEPNLRFILREFKLKKTSAAALHQLKEVLSGLRQERGYNQNAQRGYDGAGRAAWGCICEARKVLQNWDMDVKEKTEEIERGIKEVRKREGRNI